MPFEDILGLLGAGVVLPIFLVAFWKADDAISPTLKNDISRWLLSADVPSPRRPWLDVINGIFVNVFGKSHFSLRCVAASYLISILASFMIFYIVTTWLDSVIAPNFTKFRWPSGSRLVALLSMIFLVNPVADFLNLLISRKALERLAETKSIISLVAIVAFVSTAPLVLSLMALLFGIVLIEIAFSTAVSLDDFVWRITMLSTTQLGSMFSYGMALTLLMTTFITTIWFWSALAGSIVFRALLSSRTIYAYLTYALPVDDRPIRSIGLFFTALAGFILLLRNIISNILTLI